MKYRPELSKVRWMLCERLDKLAKDTIAGWSLISLGTSIMRSEKTREIGKVDEEWTKICSGIGITRTGNNIRTENEILMEDPMPTGVFLEMSEDTVQKILVLGVP